VHRVTLELKTAFSFYLLRSESLNYVQEDGAPPEIQKLLLRHFTGYPDL
jgi:hypothetical protein